MRSLWFAACAICVTIQTFSPATASPRPGRTQTGSVGKLGYIARNTIVGQGSTAIVASGGQAAYLAQAQKYNGVVGLLMTTASGDQFSCTGSLLNNRRSIATAAHCVSNGGTVQKDIVSTKAFFFDGAVTNDPNVFAAGGGVTVVDISKYAVNSAYTGQVVDQNDIAVLSLASLAPEYAKSYALYSGNDLTGKQFNVAGLGLRSTVGGASGLGPGGANAIGAGRRRQGDNIYDFRLGDKDFGGFFDEEKYYGFNGPERFFGTAETSFVYMSDFDNGLSRNDAGCALGGFFGRGGAKYCNTGVGQKEVGIAPGDSGGPGFIDGQLASINSFGLTFRTPFRDVDNSLNFSWGEFAGYVPTHIHRDFITAAMAAVPEPGTWLQMILGFGILGGAMRRGRGPAFRSTRRMPIAAA